MVRTAPLPRRRETRPVGNTGERREAGAGVAEHAGIHGQAVLVAVVVVGAEGDIVREQRGEFKGIRVAADPGQLVGVVDPALAGDVNARCPGDPQRQQGRTQHMLHRLAKTQVNGERQRGQDFAAAGLSR
ncbi:hypothetical protein QFZ40_003007 [Arthrobacter pascens]|uniref:hypothetical protein n=1 Tax=Arthrobacter pascens TaxID=1677 RepID=UPI00278B0188|nr:hypothetical protein [Arthrobacter pascens]MDQ0635098.1 hypothetical protein [Arthrobacter pascens]